MANSIKRPWCVICGRGPSLMGNEPLYVIPSVVVNEKVTDFQGLIDAIDRAEKKFVFYCGNHFSELIILAECKINQHSNFMNLVTHQQIILLKTFAKYGNKYKIVVVPYGSVESYAARVAEAL